MTEIKAEVFSSFFCCCNFYFCQEVVSDLKAALCYDGCLSNILKQLFIDLKWWPVVSWDFLWCLFLRLVVDVIKEYYNKKECYCFHETHCFKQKSRPTDNLIKIDLISWVEGDSYDWLLYHKGPVPSNFYEFIRLIGIIVL